MGTLSTEVALPILWWIQRRGVTTLFYSGAGMNVGRRHGNHGRERTGRLPGHACAAPRTCGCGRPCHVYSEKTWSGIVPNFGFLVHFAPPLPPRSALSKGSNCDRVIIERCRRRGYAKYPDTRSPPESLKLLGYGTPWI